MPVSRILPRGCSRARGCADTPQLRSVGGGGLLAQQANRFYMLTVKRESLMNKKESLSARLKDINNQLTEIESDLHAIETKYKDILHPGEHGRRRAAGKAADQAKGRAVRTMPFQY